MTIAGVPYQNPLAYTGPQMNLIPIKVFFREPTFTDKSYRIGSVALIGKNPSSGSEGELWYLSKFNSSGEAIWLQLSTGAANPGIDTITTNSGLPQVEPDGNGNINILGGIGCTVTGNGPGNTVTIDVEESGLDWSIVQAGTQDIEIGHGYISDFGAGVVYTLPATANVGDMFVVSNINAGGFRIVPNAGQTIHIGPYSCTTGITGYVISTDIGDTLTLTCARQDTDFWSFTPPQGNFTLV